MGLNKHEVFVLLGVHRSGTSLGARILGELGLRLGDDLIPGHRDNPGGFSEHSAILTETRKIEDKLGLNPFRGDRLLPPDGEWWSGQRLLQHYKDLRWILKKEARKKGDPFGFKDPRTLQLLPMWQELFKDVAVKPRHVLLLRHPTAVARSIAKRNGLDEKHGEFIWLSHLCCGLRALERPPEAVLHYEGWFENPDSQVEKALTLLGHGKADRDEAVAKVAAIADPGQIHHRAGDGQQEALFPETERLYRILGANATAEADWTEVHAIADEVIARAGFFSSVYRSVADRAARVDRRLERQKEEMEALREKTRTLAEQTRPTAEGEAVREVEPRPANPYAAEFPDLQAFVDAVDGPGKKLKVCIATEDIVGPIRNGGIGTTYTHLSRLLAKAGHEVHVVYLRGQHCENRSIDYWINWYREFGVTFVPVDPEDYPLDSPAPRWIRPMYALYEYLKQERFDAVHVSEWRGSAFLSLLAKRQGLAFDRTVFCVKTSSPWLWNREYGFHTITHLTDLPKMYAERRSVELGDLVIGGSRHLLRWMLEHGYKVPMRQTYSQPNVVVPANLDDLAEPRRRLYGQRVRTEEMVFFGRLEYRKGLDIFCDAVDNLVAKGVKLPPKICFLGKFGEKIPSYPELTIPEYIEARSKDWPTEIDIRKNYGNEEALRFLLERQRLAVMPSIIENSSLAVYETCYYGIPFVASDSGGTPELIDPEHLHEVVCEPHPVPLADKLEEAIREGGFVARPSFDNDKNLALWLRFHSSLGAYVYQLQPREEVPGPRLSICLVVSDDHEFAEQVVGRVKKQLSPEGAEVVVIDNGSTRKETIRWLRKVRQRKGELFVVEDLPGWGEQHAQNYAAEHARGELLAFVKPGGLPKPGFVDTVRRVGANTDAAVMGCFYDLIDAEQMDERDPSGARQGFFLGDYSYAFFDPENISPVLVVRRDAFLEMEGFREDYKVPGAETEFVARASLRNYEVETVPEPLVWYVHDYPDRRRFNYKALPYRSIRPYLEEAPQCYSRILLTARGGAKPGAWKTNKSGKKVQPMQASDHPFASVEQKARAIADEAGRFPRLRVWGWRMYHGQVRLFRKLLNLEIAAYSRLVRVRLLFGGRRKQK